MESILGEIRAFAGNYAPQGWAMCDGSLLSIYEYNALFALLGTTYGGDGVNNFAVPDLRGRIVVGTGVSTSGTTYLQGQAGGVEETALGTSNIPNHTHGFTVKNTPGNLNTASNNFFAAPRDVANPANTVAFYLPHNSADTTEKQVSFNGATINFDAGSASFPHENRQPYLTISYIISLQGIFPQFQ